MRTFRMIGMALIAVLMCVNFAACSDDDDVDVSNDLVVGQWDVNWVEMDGESMDVPQGYININLKSSGNYTVNFLDEYYVGTWELQGNTVVGTTNDPITEYYKFTELDGKKATIDYSNSEGDKYKFKATKR